ncbi:hypothetical protein Syun_006568 [Stephania yunnanensis]|uniref:R13L1/DRL21-like LRR repeat region domain-containing protein n=1 Tax=Stephania yunnanensis TaxID=152371 RepID=A0AAP0KWS4_9MAGN
MVAYDADDVLDEIVYEGLRRKVEGQKSCIDKVQDFFLNCNPLAFHIKTAHMIRDINNKLEAIEKDKGRFKLDVKPAASLEISSVNRETASFVKDVRSAKKAKLSEKKDLDTLGLEWDWSEYCDKVNDDHVLEVMQSNSNLKELHILAYLGSKFPSWIVSSSILGSLVKINFYRCHRCEYLPCFGGLPALMIREMSNAWAVHGMAGRIILMLRLLKKQEKES